MSELMRDNFERVRLETARMAGFVQRSVTDACEALVRGDVRLAREVRRIDQEIDAAEIRIERSAIDLLSLYRPVAGEFRRALMTLRANADLERCADCASHVAMQVGCLTVEASQAGHAFKISPSLTELAKGTSELTRSAVRAYNTGDCDLAEQVINGDERLDALYGQVLQEAEAELAESVARRGRHLPTIMAAKNLERIGDHCTNVAEATLYIARGELVRHRHAV